MADLVTRLKLDDKNFNENIIKSKKQLNDFKNVGANAGNTISTVLGNALTKVVVPITIATTAMKGFQEVMASSQQRADWVTTEMEGLKAAVDEFFYALGNGNLETFINNLDTVITKSKEAYQALDQLGNTQISYGVINAQNQGTIAEAQYVAKNKFASNDERIAAFEQWRQAIESEQQSTVQLQSDLITYVSKAVSAKSSANLDVTLADVIKAFQVDLTGANRDEIKQRAKYGYENWERHQRGDSSLDAEGQKQLLESQKENIIIHTMLQKYTDEELKNIAAQVQQYFKLTSAVKGLGREYNETANEFNNANAKTNGFTPVQSLEGFTVYSGNNDAGKNFKGDAKKASVDELLTWNVEGWINEEIKGLHNPLRKAIESGDKIPIKSLPIEIEEEVVDELIPNLDDSPNKWALSLSDSFALAGSSIQALGSAFGAFSENAALGKSAMILGAIGQLVYAYASVSKNVTSPWEWIAFAISGAATLATVIGQLKGYADGGIIDSPYTTGDRNLIRVNGGEMVLTKAQQSNLFSMLQHGTASNGGGNVTFRIQGKELVGVLNNYNNKTSKVL